MVLEEVFVQVWHLDGFIPLILNRQVVLCLISLNFFCFLFLACLRVIRWISIL